MMEEDGMTEDTSVVPSPTRMVESTGPALEGELRYLRIGGVEGQISL